MLETDNNSQRTFETFLKSSIKFLIPFQQLHLIFHTSVKWFLVLCLCYRQGNWGTEWLNKFLMATGRTERNILAVFFWNRCFPSFSTLHPQAILALLGPPWCYQWSWLWLFDAAIWVNIELLPGQISLTFLAVRQDPATTGITDPNPNPGVISQLLFVTLVCVLCVFNLQGGRTCPRNTFDFRSQLVDFNT